MKRIISFLLILLMIVNLARPLTVVAAGKPEDDTENVTISNQFIKLTVNKENGGYVISTLEGDILNKSDNDVDLTHRGENMDSSFTSFRIGDEDFIFGNDYGFLKKRTQKVQTEVDAGGQGVTSTWSIDDIRVEQKITLVNSQASEQLGTALITYTVYNDGEEDQEVKSRVLMDTKLGDKDYGFYELPNQRLGDGYEYIEFERAYDCTKDNTIVMPADYFVRERIIRDSSGKASKPVSSGVVGFGVNSVLEEDKPYRMTFAHWANIAATKFDYEPDPSLNFTNPINDTKVADSAAALYFDLDTVKAHGKHSFSTYYGVTANIKNKDNKVLVNITAPSKMEFTDDTRTAYKGSEEAVGDNIIRINTTVTNPVESTQKFKNLAVVAYTSGFTAQRQTQLGNWIPYDNANPINSQLNQLQPGTNKVTYFDFKFEPQAQPQLGSFIIKVFNMDESVNELGAYAEEFCLATTENFIILPGQDPSLPAITLAGLEPGILYNEGSRYMTVHGQGVSFFKSDLLETIELRNDNDKNLTYFVPVENISYEQDKDTTSAVIQLEEYMKPGRYQVVFKWKEDAQSKENALQGVPREFTSTSMYVQMSADPKYRNDKYGVLTIQKDPEKEKAYKVVPYRDETSFEEAKIKPENLFLTIRGDVIQDNNDSNIYRLLGKEKDVTINHILNYHGSDFVVRQLDEGTAEVLMDGLLTSIGANTEIRNGTAAFRLNAGTEYLVPEYDAHGIIQSNGELGNGQKFIVLQWNSPVDNLLTIGGFLIDLKYGVLGKIINDDKTKSDIISFGGALDMSFITPGAAAAVRENQKKASMSWSSGGKNNGKTWNNEVNISAGDLDADPVGAGVAVHDVLYGGKDPGYIGINMEAHAGLPQIVSFLPNRIEADLSVNTIGKYEVEFNGTVETAMLEMDLCLVVKENPSGAPIPDKLKFTIGGFEPGLNVDGMGILWLTGGGGGFDNLYDTIYGTDGVPPLTLLLNVQFDIVKIMSGSADLSLSLRGASLELGEVTLKKVKNMRFLDSGLVAVKWYPNFGLNLEANVNFNHIFWGGFSITASAGDAGNKDFVEFVLYVAVGLPKFIPIIGGMEIASAELGGGSERMWGTITLLQTIQLGFNYYWGGDVEFTSGMPKSRSLRTSRNLDMNEPGVMRTVQMFHAMTAPMQVGADPGTGNIQYASVGQNLEYEGGSTVKDDFDKIKKSSVRPVTLWSMMRMPGAQYKSSSETHVYTNEDRDEHLVSIGEQEDYILTVSRSDKSKITAEYLKEQMKMTNDGRVYTLNYYSAPAEGIKADDEEKQKLLEESNVNVVDGIAYIMIPEKDLGNDRNFLLKFNDKKMYDVSAIKVNPVGELTEQHASVSSDKLTVNWKGKNLSDTAQIIISLAGEGQKKGGVVLETVPAKYDGENGRATITIPEGFASGKYTVRVTLSDEGNCYKEYTVDKSVSIKNSSAPEAPKLVTLKNAGNEKLLAEVTGPDDKSRLNGYMADVYVYEEDTQKWVLADAGLYFDKDQKILLGGSYDMPVLDANGNRVPEKGTDGGEQKDAAGNTVYKTVKVGYCPGKKYKVSLRSTHVDETEKTFCSEAVTTNEVELKKATAPVIEMSYDVNKKQFHADSDTEIKAQIYLDGNTEKFYSFDFSKNITQELNLPDGDHTFELHAEDRDGDQVILTEIIAVDTTAPVLMLESPVSGGSFSGDNLEIRGIGESNAKYTYKLDGKTVEPRKNTRSVLNSGTQFSHILPLGDVADHTTVTLLIQATDPAGNVTEKTIQLMNGKIANVEQLQLQLDEKYDKNGQYRIPKGQKAAFNVLGVTCDGKKLNLNGVQGLQTELFGESLQSDSDNRLEAVQNGNSLLKATFDLGGGRVLTDAAVVYTSDVLYSTLDNALKQAGGCHKEDYTEESWDVLSSAVEIGKKIQSDEQSVQEAVDVAANQILQAIAQLVRINSSVPEQNDKADSGQNSQGGQTEQKVDTAVTKPKDVDKNTGDSKPHVSKTEKIESSYTVQFNSNGGSEVISQTVSENGKVKEPAAPVREGYTFEGWYTDAECSEVYDFENPVKRSFTLYAKWDEKKLSNENSDTPETSDTTEKPETPKSNEINQKSEDKGSLAIWIISVIAVLATAGGAGWWFSRKRKTAKKK